MWPLAGSLLQFAGTLAYRHDLHKLCRQSVDGLPALVCLCGLLLEVCCSLLELWHTGTICTNCAGSLWMASQHLCAYVASCWKFAAVCWNFGIQARSARIVQAVCGWPPSTCVLMWPLAGSLLQFAGTLAYRHDLHKLCRQSVDGLPALVCLCGLLLEVCCSLLELWHTGMICTNCAGSL